MRALAAVGLLALLAIPAFAFVQSADENMADMSFDANAADLVDANVTMNASTESNTADRPWYELRTLGSGADAIILYADLSGQGWGEGPVQRWTRIFSRRPPPGVPAGTWQIRQQYEIDCDARRFAPIATRYFAEDGRELGDFPVADAPNLWPEAARDALIDHGCGLDDEMLREVLLPEQDARARLLD